MSLIRGNRGWYTPLATESQPREGRTAAHPSALFWRTKMGHLSLAILEESKFFGADFLIFEDLKFSVSFVSFVTFVSFRALRRGAMYLLTGR